MGSWLRQDQGDGTAGIFKGQEHLSVGKPFVLHLHCGYPIHLSYPDFEEKFRRGRLIEAILKPVDGSGRAFASIHYYAIPIEHLSTTPQMRSVD